jgi:hypothetical protein
LGIEDTTQGISCTCSACEASTAIGLRNGFAYQCDSAITGQCLSFDCEGRCNGDDPAILPPVMDDFPNTQAPTPVVVIRSTPAPTPGPEPNPTPVPSPAVGTQTDTTGSGACDPICTFWMAITAILCHLVFR